MKANRRLSKENLQEIRSRSQFSDLIASHGWLADDNIEDVEEDFLVRIFDNGVWVDSLLMIQIKSTTAMQNLFIDGDTISFLLKSREWQRMRVWVK